jgi:hypothetical protein
VVVVEEEEEEEEDDGAQDCRVEVTLTGASLSDHLRVKWGRDDITITRISATALNELRASMTDYTEKLIVALTSRLELPDLLRAFSILDPSFYRGADDEATLRAEASDSLDVLLGFYACDKPYQAPNGRDTLTATALVDRDAAIGELDGFFIFFAQKSREQSTDPEKKAGELKDTIDIWRDYRSYIVTHFPNFAKLIMIMLVLPMSNALVERHFSTMNNIHTELRNKLLVYTVDSLMTVAIEGPPIKGIDDTSFLSEILAVWNTLPPSEKSHSGASGTTYY